MANLEGIIATFGPALARLAASYEADTALQEDLLQEIMLAGHRALPSLKDQDRIAPFVFRIAHNRSVTHVIRQSARRRLPVLTEPQSDGSTPEENLLSNESSH